MNGPLRKLVNDTVTLVLSQFYQKQRKGWTDPSEITLMVCQDRDLAFALESLPPHDPLDIKGLVRQSIRNMVHGAMKGTRDEYGIRFWETVAIPGKSERRWMPTRGVMTIRDMRSAGQKKIDESKRDWREGRLLVLMSQVGEQMGLGLDDAPAGEMYESIAGEAVRRLDPAA